MMVHKTEGLARPCSATDLILSTSYGLQCGNCLAVEQDPEPERWCTARAADDKPCPLLRTPGEPDGLCWIHRLTRVLRCEEGS